MIQLKNVSKSFGSGHSRVEVLKDISLNIKPATLNVFLGRSGSGKSTLLNLMAGIEKADQGTIEVLGHEISGYNGEQLALFRLNHIGLVFQFFNLLPTLTLAENIALSGQLKNLSKKEIQTRVLKAQAQVQLSEEGSRMPHEASGGEIQRAAIARALVGHPDIILADEPTGNLDFKNREIVAAIFQNLVREEKKTVLIVTHDPSFEAIGDQIFHLENGKITG